MLVHVHTSSLKFGQHILKHVCMLLQLYSARDAAQLNDEHRIIHCDSFQWLTSTAAGSYSPMCVIAPCVLTLRLPRKQLMQVEAILAVATNLAVVMELKEAEMLLPRQRLAVQDPSLDDPVRYVMNIVLCFVVHMLVSCCISL